MLIGICYIKVRKNTRVGLKTSHILRNILVKSQRNGFKIWKDNTSYGQRQVAAETIFFSIKRMFGECVYSVKFEHVIPGNNVKNIII